MYNMLWISLASIITLTTSSFGNAATNGAHDVSLAQHKEAVSNFGNQQLYPRSSRNNAEPLTQIAASDSGNRLDRSLAPLDRLFLIALDAVTFQGAVEAVAITYEWKLKWIRLGEKKICEDCTVPEEFREYVAQRVFRKIGGTREIEAMEEYLSETYLGYFGRGARPAYLKDDKGFEDFFTNVMNEIATAEGHRYDAEKNEDKKDNAVKGEVR